MSAKAQPPVSSPESMEIDNRCPAPVSLRRKQGGSVTQGELQRHPKYVRAPDRCPVQAPPCQFILDLHHKTKQSVTEEDGGEEQGHSRQEYHMQRIYQPLLSCLVLSFTDLTYNVKNPQRSSRFFRRHHFGGAASVSSERKKTLLDSVSGEAREGDILAVMGPSGSGKTTLLDALAGRISGESLGGSVALNGEPMLSSRVDGGPRRPRPLIAAISAYVMQDDLLYPMLTVEETLSFAAQLRLALSACQRWNRVKALLDQLDLSAAAGTIIGDEGHRGVSGGERRRVSIGVGIVHDPLLLFLDEPTSGLDSTSAFMVAKVVRRIAESGSAVVMSIHQPSSRILDLLDRVMLLSRGRAVYSGTPAGIRPFFAAFGRPIPDGVNRAEFALDLIRELESGSSSSNLVDDSGRLVEFNKSWQQKQQLFHGPNNGSVSISLKNAISASISRGKLVSGAAAAAGTNPYTGTAAASTSALSAEANKFPNPFWVEVLVLMHRSFINARRQPKLFLTRMAMVLLTALTISTLFHRLPLSPSGARDRTAVFAVALAVVFYVSAEPLPSFLDERSIFVRETAHHTYRRSSFVVALTLSSFPSLVILAATLALTTFFPLGLAGGWRGLLFYFVSLLAAFWAASSFVTFLAGIVSKSAEVAGFDIVIQAITIFVLLSGFFVMRDSVPWYWRWFHYASPVKYPYEATVQGEMLADGGKRCFFRGWQVFEGSPLEAVPEAIRDAVLHGMAETMGFNITSQTCLANGADILRWQGITELGKWECIWIAVAWGFLFRGFFYVTLLRISNKRK